MKALALSLMFVGAVLVIVNELLHVRSREPEIVYKYVPRDLDAFLKDPENQPMVMYQGMFGDPPVRTY